MGMPFPQDNYINYDKTDLVRNLETIKDKQFLLVHGTADRKVNIQHSMLLMKALTEKGAPFKIQVFINEAEKESLRHASLSIVCAHPHCSRCSS